MKDAPRKCWLDMNTKLNTTPGCVMFIVDESAAMQSPIQDEIIEHGQLPKTKGEATANAINALLNQLSSGPEFDLSIVGYRSDASGNPEVSVRWCGVLAGREFVSTNELATKCIAKESRMRLTPDPAAFSGFRSIKVEFPVWYVPEFGGAATRRLAFRRCIQLLEGWVSKAGSNPGQPLLIHLFSSSSAGDDPTSELTEIRSMKCGDQEPLVFQAQLSSNRFVPPRLYPANWKSAAKCTSLDLFQQCSVLGTNHVSALLGAGVSVVQGSRGLLLNAKVIDLVRFLSLVKTHVQGWVPHSR